MNDVFIILLLLSLIGFIILGAIFIVYAIQKKPKKNIGRVVIVCFIGLIVFSISGIITAPSEEELILAAEEKEKVEAEQDKKEAEKEQKEKAEKAAKKQKKAEEKEAKEQKKWDEQRDKVLEKEKAERERQKQKEAEQTDNSIVSTDAELVLQMMFEDVAKSVAKNSGTVDTKTMSMGFWRNGRDYAVEGQFECSNLMGVKQTYTLKLVCKATEDYSKIQAKEIWLDGVLVKTG